MSQKSLPHDISELESAISYKFKNKALIARALTHSSYANELKAKGAASSSNERLEFLGDSVLSLAVSEYLFKNYPEMPEGELSRVRAGAVCEKALGGFAADMKLGNYLFIGHGEENTNGRERISILADAFEAVLAALFLDGGLKAAKKFLMPHVIAEINKIMASGHTEDYKTLLQQIVQQEQGELLEYVLTGESGPAHRRVFKIEARLNNNVIGLGTGRSKREAEQNAAKEAVSLFGGLK